LSNNKKAIIKLQSKAKKIKVKAKRITIAKKNCFGEVTSIQLFREKCNQKKIFVINKTQKKNKSLIKRI